MRKMFTGIALAALVAVVLPQTVTAADYKIGPAHSLEKDGTLSRMWWSSRPSKV